MELNPVKVEPQVWYLVGMDLIGPFQPTAEGNRYVLTMTDYFSKYVEGVAIPDKTALSVPEQFTKSTVVMGPFLALSVTKERSLQIRYYNYYDTCIATRHAEFCIPYFDVVCSSGLGR